MFFVPLREIQLQVQTNVHSKTLKLKLQLNFRASPLFHVKELFSANRESHIRVSKFLPEYVGVPDQLKISVESNKLEIIKEALYIREITILYKHKFYR